MCRYQCSGVPTTKDQPSHSVTRLLRRRWFRAAIRRPRAALDPIRVEIRLGDSRGVDERPQRFFVDALANKSDRAIAECGRESAGGMPAQFGQRLEWIDVDVLGLGPRNIALGLDDHDGVR